MQIRFSPDIGQRITASPPISASHISSYVILQFDAAVEHDEYEQVRKDGARLQLWTNCPFGTETEWRDHDFTEDSNDVNKSGEVGRRFLLYLSVVLPPGVDELEFSYTYRVLYPDGRVKWLGKFGQNGSCVVERHSSRVILSDQWRCRGGITYDLDADESSKSNLAILAGIDSDIFNLHAINSDGGSGDTEDCSLLFVIPKHSLGSHALTQGFTISSSPGSSISLSPAGNVTVNAIAKTSLLLQVYDIRTDLLFNVGRALTHAAQNSVRILSLDPKSGVLVLAPSNRYRFPVHLLGIGLFLWNNVRITELELKWNDIRDMLANASNTVCMYSHRGAVASISWDDVSPKHISLNLGAQYTLSPEYRLRSRHGYWRTSILSGYKNIRPADVDPISILQVPPQVSRATPRMPSERNGPVGNRIRPAKDIKTLIGFLGGYARYYFAAVMVPISILFRFLSIPRLGSGKPKSIETRAAPTTVNDVTPRGQEGKTINPVASEPIATSDRGFLRQPRPCGGLTVRVFPGPLTILLSSEADATADNRVDIPVIKMHDKVLDRSIEQKDDGTFLIRAFVDEETDIEVVPV